MTANVRCAGLAAEYQMGQKIEAETDPCGWIGARYQSAQFTEEQARSLGHFSPQWHAEVRAAERRIRTAKPCPRCGGRVELIPEES